jgi:DNA-binding response OmpR family regulator
MSAFALAENTASSFNHSAGAQTRGERSTYDRMARQSASILIIHHDPAVIGVLQSALEASGHCVQSLQSGRNLLREHAHLDISLVLLGEPGDRSALQMLAWLRARMQSAIPVVFLAEPERRTDMIAALSEGADDALTLPVQLDELCVRIQAQLRRAYPESAQCATCIEWGAYRVDLIERRISLKGKDIELTPREFDLARLLFTHIDQIVPRTTLIDQVWGVSDPCTSHSLSSHIYRVKQKLELASSHGLVLRTFYSLGYRLEKVQAPAVAARSRAIDGATTSSAQFSNHV